MRLLYSSLTIYHISIYHFLGFCHAFSLVSILSPAPAVSGRGVVDIFDAPDDIVLAPALLARSTCAGAEIARACWVFSLFLPR